MCSEGPETDPSPSTPRRIHNVALSALAIFGGDVAWPEATVFAVFAVVALGVFGALILTAGRHLRWWSSEAEIRIERTFRVTFGVLVLAALIVPYALTRAPAVGWGLLMLGGLLVISLLFPIGPRPHTDRSTGEHAEVD